MTMYSKLRNKISPDLYFHICEYVLIPLRLQAVLVRISILIYKIIHEIEYTTVTDSDCYDTILRR